MLIALPLLLMAGIPQSDAVDRIIRAEMAKSKIPGVAVAILRNGKPVKMKGYGYANMEHKVPVKPETIFQSGSVGKQFTSTLAMILVKEGKLSLDDEIVKYLPEGKGKWEGIKVRHLMSHTSGLSDLPYWDMGMRIDHTEADLVKFMLAQPPPKYKPGPEWRYNNGGYVMLGVLLGRVGGKFYGDLLQDKIFRPLGTKTARVISEEDIIPNRAAGYVLTEGVLKNQAWVAPKFNTTADGALYLTLHDMAKWDAALYGEKLLPKGMLDQMWTPVNVFPRKQEEPANSKRGYGFGWFLLRDGNKLLVEHSGGWQGFTCYIGRQTDKRLTVVLFSNLSTGPVEAMGRAILKEVGSK
jgi:CubicO group peptidase (beta-lactamase class C family)